MLFTTQVTQNLTLFKNLTQIASVSFSFFPIAFTFTFIYLNSFYIREKEQKNSLVLVKIFAN